MYGRGSEPAEKWSVYAEFTITHPGCGDPENAPVTRTERTDNNVRMTYSWNSQRNEATTDNSYNFQRGNMSFTSTPPPPRRPTSSGYGSNVATPNSVSSLQQPRDDAGRKCRSTCNITLCANASQADAACHHHNQAAHCGRTQSLRCQTPSSRSDCRNAYYGCGDPWCHHLRAGDDLSTARGFSPVPEEECGSLSSNANARSLSDIRKDVSVQTFEMVDKCTSPFLRVDDDDRSDRNDGKRKKVRRRSATTYQRKPEVIYQRSRSPSSFTPDSLESGSKPHPRRLTRSPKLKRMPQVKHDNSDVTTTTTTTTTEDKSSGSKKPRTVHIDVYCTGTEAESDSSDLSGNETPQTVFESDQVRITHKRADSTDVPKTIQENSGLDLAQKEDKDAASDSDNASTAYPSKLSSYSTVRDFASSISSVPPSWTDYSIPDFDSVANTSWKDNTYSDLDFQSRSSIGNTESLLFVPKKLREKSYSIDETPELVPSSSQVSLRQSDSFEYADSEDKLRIQRMATMWKEEEERSRKAEARKKEQERKMNEFIRQKRRDLAKKESKESDSDDSADSGKAWTFIKDDSKKLERDTTIRRHSKILDKDKGIEEVAASKPSLVDQKRGYGEILEKDKEKEDVPPPPRKPSLVDQGSLSDSNPSPSCRTPSVALMQRLSLDPTLRAPFTIAPGLYTEQRNIARKFGQVITVFRKPGHHVGPVRNPECACAHCKDYYEKSGFRTRTRSVGDQPSRYWKNIQ